MNKQSQKIESIDNNAPPGSPLAAWTYSNAELFELEYEALFLSRWQFVAHVNDVPNTGDYRTANIGRDSVVVIRGKDLELRAFRNVCRHRASRILEGSGTCRGVVRCPYHGWTYQLDGSLMAVPQQENFPDIDRSKFGLHHVQMEVFNGLIFVRITGDGPSVAEQFAHTAGFFPKYDVANYEEIAEPTTQIWDVNWKVAWDNYLENYHIPISHPGLNRLLIENGEWDELSSGVNYGVFVLKDKPSKVDEERLYQEQFHHANHRVPDDLKGKWVQFGLMPNLGIDLYPEMLDMFQIIPLAPDKTMIRAAFYGHTNPSAEEEELRRLNMLINESVNEEDRQICLRVQQGLQTQNYEPGPLSQQESGIFNFHEMIRNLIPVASLTQQPENSSIAAENLRLKSGR
jgi:phenylpropionate dioxygenase-like ring-hydroxylating dioxygenase large terminal subunit